MSYTFFKCKKLQPKVFCKLNSFTGDKSILRVGGRLAHSNLSYTQKYPILLPIDHQLTIFLIEFYHKSYFYDEPQNF